MFRCTDTQVARISVDVQVHTIFNRLRVFGQSQSPVSGLGKSPMPRCANVRIVGDVSFEGVGKPEERDSKTSNAKRSILR